MPLIGAEAGAASLLAGLASAIVSAYLADWLGFRIVPLAVLLPTLATIAAVWLGLRRMARTDFPATLAFWTTVAGTFAWLMWRARPDFLPTGTGSDLAHHLALIAFIERHGRLVHDAAIGAYLGEMIDYTPGAHLLAVIAAGWMRVDALHALHAVVSAAVALKAGIVLLIARSLMPPGAPGLRAAIVAVLLLWLPYAFFVGSFMEQSFLSQVVSETFAVGMWWTIVVWDERPAAWPMALFAVFGAGAFLTWPIWVGPLALTLAAAAMTRVERPPAQRVAHLLLALIPIAGLVTLYALGRRVYGFDMVHAVGFAIWPTPVTLTWPFIAVAIPGVAWTARSRRTRSAAILLAAIVLQASALAITGRRGGATAPYLSLKMTYLAIYPIAVAAAVAIAGAWEGAQRSSATALLARVGVVAVILVIVGSAGRSLLVSRAKPVVTQPVYLAGSWAREHLPPACIDYLVADGYTAYWLHLAVLANPRAAGRSLDDDTFDPKKATVRWILPNGLPYAIAGDFDALPRDIRTNVDVLAQFGRAAVLKRRGPSVCADNGGSTP